MPIAASIRSPPSASRSTAPTSAPAVPRAWGPAPSAGCGTRAIACGRIERRRFIASICRGRCCRSWPGAHRPTRSSGSTSRRTRASRRLWRCCAGSGPSRAGRSPRSAARCSACRCIPGWRAILIAARGSFEGSCGLRVAVATRRRFDGPRAATSCDLLPIIDQWARMPQHLRRVADQLQRASRQILGSAYRERIDEAELRRALLAGYPDRVAKRRPQNARGSGRRQGDARYRTRRGDRTGKRRPRRRLAGRARRDVGTGIRDHRGDRPARIANRAGVADANIERGDA